MKNPFYLALPVGILALCACSESSSPTGSESTSGRIEAGLLGTWIENPPSLFPDTLLFSENKIQVPFFSAVGSQFTAKDGLVKGGPGLQTYGEYLRNGDTLYYDALLGVAPDGINKANATRYLKKAP